MVTAFLNERQDTTEEMALVSNALAAYSFIAGKISFGALQVFLFAFFFCQLEHIYQCSMAELHVLKHLVAKQGAEILFCVKRFCLVAVS